MDPNTRDLVKSFLLDLKHATGECIVRGLERNEETKIELDLTDEEVRDEILELSVCDYCKGPEKDRGGIEGDVWVFGKVVKEREVYIKLKLWGDQRGHGIRIMSFHFPKYPLRYPFRSR